jgi:hypothetical protein
MIEPATVWMFIQRKDDLKYGAGWATDPKQNHVAVHARFGDKGSTSSSQFNTGPHARWSDTENMGRVLCFDDTELLL